MNAAPRFLQEIGANAPGATQLMTRERATPSSAGTMWQTNQHVERQRSVTQLILEINLVDYSFSHVNLFFQYPLSIIFILSPTKTANDLYTEWCN